MTSKKNLIKTLGPGILFASTAIGVSHLVQSTRAGADYSFGLIAAIIIANLLKYPFFEFGSRYANSTGTSLIDGYKKMGQWMLILYFIITISTMFFVTAAVGMVTAGFMENLFGVDTPMLMNSILFIICLLILIIGKYSLLDSLIKIVGAVLLISTILAFSLTLFHGPSHPQQFQLPDLGSKVIIGGRGTGLYNNDFIDRGGESNVVTNRVGPQIEVTSNFGNTITANYNGNMQLAASGTVNMLGNPRYNVERETSETTLNIDNFQGHAHNTTNTVYLNHSDNHATSFFGGKDYAKKLANSGAGHTFDFSRDWETVSSHKHNITTPNSYNSNFTYSHPQQEIDLSSVAATVDVDVSDQEKLDELVTPFILVEYIIKF